MTLPSKVLFSLLFITTLSFSQAIPYGNNPAAGSYHSINGIQLYSEAYGQGKPFVILHGNGGSIHSHWREIEYYSKYFRVIAVDSRGHGKSVDTSQTLHYEQMALDIKVLLDTLKIDSAYIYGQSDGGILGLIIACRYPSKVSKLATFGANIFPGPTAVYKELDDMVLETLKTTTDRRTKRLYELLAYEPNITLEDLQKISCPVLLMCGDRDVIRPEHTQLIFQNIKNANQATLPGCTHFGAREKPELFNSMLLPFLQGPFNKKSSVELFTGKH
jgi:pimeloyl-ACP methyl ester carboxylesterase